ncbi:MAG: hypothetical protein K2I00_01525 [Ruminococcus sp.]|nr:hypothetical protein [Ruminococcus sp.]
MNHSETNKNRRTLIIAVAFFIAAATCQMFSMVKSSFLSVFSAEVSVSFLVMLAFIYGIFKFFRSESAMYTASFISVILFANWSQLMLHYTCNSDKTDDILKKVINFMLYAAFSMLSICVIFMILDKIKRFRKLCLGIFSVVAVGMSMLVLIFSAKDSNTSTTASGFQPAILIMFLMLYAFSGAMAGNNGIFAKFIYIALFWGMMIILFLKHESGIPVMTCAACMITYIFFNKSAKEPWFIIFNIAVAVIGFAAIIIASPAIRKDIIVKFSTRVDDNEHWRIAEANLQASSLFGSESYDVCLNEASSDYALNVNVHYFGYIWLALMMLSFFIMSISIYRDVLSNSNDNIISNLRKLAYIAICVNVIYNISDNICGAPVVGVQMIGCGISRSIALLTGLLIGSVIADSQKMKLSIVSFLEKTGVITAA